MLFLLILLAVVLIVIAVGLEGLVVWGIGSFICWAFSIPFVFTYWQGLAIAIVISFLASMSPTVKFNIDKD